VERIVEHPHQEPPPAQNNVLEYGWRDATAPPSMEFIVPAVLRLLQEIRVKRVLDLGSGNGALSAVLQKSGYDVVGVEYDKKGFELSARLYPTIRFYNLGVHNDPKELRELEGEFDAVISTEVIEHLYSPHLLPQFARGVLASGAHLVLSTPYHGYLKNLALSLLNRWDNHLTPLWHGGHIKFWSRRTLSTLLCENDFDVVRFVGAGRISYLWKSMILVARKR